MSNQVYRDVLSQDDINALIEYYRDKPDASTYHWRCGDIFVWDRQQYHISTDFTRHGLVKKFLIMFVA